jgi:hypothetical protein
VLLEAVLDVKEFNPIAVLPSPVVLFDKAPTPTEVLAIPVVLRCKEFAPNAVLFAPVVLSANVELPTAVFAFPVVLDCKADLKPATPTPPPIAVL